MSYYIKRYGNSLLNPFFNDFFMSNASLSSEKFGSLSMKTDVEPTDFGYKMSVELPGIKKEDIAIDYEDEYLTIKASANTALGSEDGKERRYTFRERFSGSASRTYHVGEIDRTQIKANFENGVLTIELPLKKEEEKPSTSIAIG